jgi:hypothetical protein
MKTFDIFIVIILYLSSATLISCSKEITIEIPETPPSLVIESLLVPYMTNGKHLGVKVSASRHIFDTATTEPIINATILLYKDGVLMDTLVYDSTPHISFYPLGFGPMQGPMPGETYSIEVSVPGHESVYAETHIPEKVSIEDVVIERIGYFDESGLVYSKLTITFTDPPIEENHYEIVVTSIGQEYATNSYSMLSTYETFIVNEPHYPDEIRLDLHNPKRLLFNDREITGKQVEIDFYYLAGQRGGGVHLLTNDIIGVQLRNVSREYYNYQSTMMHSAFNREADIFYGLGEPLNVISNVTNGFGIFAGFNNDVHYLELDTLTVRR